MAIVEQLYGRAGGAWGTFDIACELLFDTPGGRPPPDARSPTASPTRYAVARKA